MLELDVSILVAKDTKLEGRMALEVVDRLNEEYRGRLKIVADSSPVADADVAVAIVWSEADRGLVRIARAARIDEKILFVKTDLVPVDLKDRALVSERLDATARLQGLLREHASSFKVVAFEEPGFSTVLEKELRRVVDLELGFVSTDVSVRPQLGTTYLERPRLLNALPDTPGHVVLMEAAYGYGKSVLAGQWAKRLEAEGWRVVWVGSSYDGSDVRSLVASALGVSDATPDGLLRDRLWEVPTLVVIEDLMGAEDLTFVLEDPKGLVLFASRRPIRHALLEELPLAKRVVRLGANDLAFSRSEAEHLVGDRQAGARLHAETLGWALPLHVASLTGSAPDRGSLLAGIRSSSSEVMWRELLFASALPHLPRSAATKATRELEFAGFVQALESSYRVHPMLAEEALARHSVDMAEIVAADAERLPLMLRGEAFERVGDFERLAGVLASPEAELWRHAPKRLIEWDAAVRGFMTPHRHWVIGAAYGRLGDFDRAIERLSLALEAPSLGPDDRLRIMRELCVPLGVTDPASADDLVVRAEPLLDLADREIAARFLGNSAIIYAHTQEPERAIEMTERALATYPENSPHRVSAETNLALFRWDLYGDFELRLQTQLATLSRTTETYPVQALGQCRDIAVFHWWLGDLATAREYLERARAGEAINPAVGIEARAALAFLDGRGRELAELSVKARDVRAPYVFDMVSMYRIRHELEAGELRRAEQTYASSSKGVFACCAYAQVLAQKGHLDEALELLDGLDAPGRVERIYVTAARYLVGREEAALRAFLGLTTAGTRLLPGFIPLEALPDDPALAAHYPIQDVLRSERQAAIQSRLSEIPDLEISLLGTMQVRLLGEPLELTHRQQQIVTLLAMGLNRTEISEAVWPEVEATKQRNRMNVQLNALRKLIEPWGVSTYLSESGFERVSIDHRVLTEAIESGDPSTIYALYQEPFAPGIDLPPVEEERARLRQAVVAALVDASGRVPSDEAGIYLERVLTLESLHEEALQRLLGLLIERGRRREAWERFSAFRDRLREEMDLEPLPETQRIVKA